ncbi:MAG: hypothetical protein U0R70_08805 [Solirubrobacteraceae bacterium]
MQANRTAPSGAPVITLTRAERDTLRCRVALLAAGGDPLADFERGDVDEALEGRRRHEACFALLDDLGWHAADSRAEYPIRHVGPRQLEQLLEEARADAAQTVTDDEHVIERLNAGDASWGSMTEIAESLAEARDLRDRDLAALRTIEQVIARVSRAPECANCRDRATHWHRSRRHGYEELLCERCARRQSEHERGEAFAAGTILRAAVRALRLAGLTDDELLDAARSAIADPEADSPASDGWAGAGDFPSDTRYQPLTPEEA